MPIPWGDFELPDRIYERAVEGCRVDKDGHWIWLGATSGKQLQPQIGVTVEVDGKKTVKVIPVAKLLYVVKYRVFPYQVRRDRTICDNKMCVNPFHKYAILEKPEPRTKGKTRKGRVKRIYDGIELEEQDYS